MHLAVPSLRHLVMKYMEGLNFGEFPLILHYYAFLGFHKRSGFFWGVYTRKNIPKHAHTIPLSRANSFQLMMLSLG